MAEVLGGVSAAASLAQQSFLLLDRVQKTLDHRKNYSMHLSTVMRDVESAKAIVERIQKSPFLQTDDLAAYIDELMRISKDIDSLVATQEELTQRGRGFRLFVHDFMKGPTEQQQLETFRDSLVASKNTLTLAIVVGLAPAGTTLSITNTKLSGMAYMQNSRIIRDESDKDWDNIIVKDVVQGGSSLMMNSSLTPNQLDKLTSDHDKRMKLEVLASLLRDPNVPAEIKQGISTAITSF
ncbi:hypothetical protein TruAng_010885 [Truncatella angustata]|nr:hypothetical protein TruAng_010885 [Truncatella angustata]